ncbi:DNA recombination protein RmuC [Salinibacterium sp. SYSU T00001]|uniref:DNA recombination protein RmuC n=1 Tax=Homoserinimonas sedimenticola TaxID=2986805 RepID=UPI00223602E8|nr:DNA recombination protein RmuC [Salinibacterium sedimenticola]MCW4386460.1 DNA recombination protein RmuC [Salinibacterium sedimenticola]
MDLIALLIGLVIGLALGVGVAVFAMRGRASAAQAGEDPAVVEARHQLALGELRAQEQAVQAQLSSQLASVQATADALREQIASMQSQHSEQVATLQSQHRELLERQRSEAQAQAERERAESKVLQALTPVQESLRTMQAKVTELERERSTQYGSIAEQLKQAQLSDEQLRVTTEQLASALRSNSTRGVWGETQLKRIVESAGLTQYVDFYTQHSIATDAGAGRPDMVVRLPGNKSIALDSKVPLEHYIEASQIPLSAVGEEAARRTQLIERHVKAVRSHIDALAKKTYWEGLDASPEFVIAFIPSESLLSSALEADPALLEYAFGKRVALASPVNLWAVLKTVAFTWQQQAVSDEAKKLFDLGNQLYQRLGTLAGHADTMRKAIERTVDSYNKFASSLESRVLVTARQFPGIDETKLDLVAEPQAITSTPQKLTATELTLRESDLALHAAIDSKDSGAAATLDIEEDDEAVA